MIPHPYASYAAQIQYIPGLVEHDDGEVEVTHFYKKRRLYVAKWWWVPVCWLLRRPTRYVA